MGLFDFLNIRSNEKEETKKAKKIANKVVKQQLLRFGMELDNWKLGIDQWEDPDNPTTIELIRVYNDIVLDAHLSAAMERRRNEALSKDYKVCDENGEEIDEETDIFNSIWFRDYLKFALDSRFFGYSLIQFGDRVGKGFKKVKLVPREYVYPQKRGVRQSPQSNYPYIPIDTGNFAPWLQFVGREGDDLGLLAKAAPQVIFKKTAQGAWAEFVELFGAPFRMGKTNIRQDELRENMFNMLENMGRNAYGVFDHEDSIEFIGDKKTDAYEVYDKNIERANNEMSKLVLGSTMIMDDGSSRSQAEVHKEGLDAISKEDCIYLQEIVNNELIPWLNRYHDFNITGYWKWDDSEKVSKDEQFKRELELIKTGKYKVSSDYITETYGIPLEEIEETDEDPNNDPGGLNNSFESKKKTLSLDNELFCGVCGGTHATDLNNEAIDDVPAPEWNELTVNEVISGVYSGKYTVENLPESVYFRIAEELTGSMEKGLRAVGDAADTFDADFVRALSNNAYVFSGAKTFQQVREMSDFIRDNAGRIVSFGEYEKKAREIFDTYNRNWLRTEIVQANNSAQMASKWQEFERDSDVLPVLKYLTVGDERVRQDHRPLDGITRPINDPFWDTYYPPNGWRCRCDVIAEDEDEELSRLDSLDFPEVPPSMQINVGKKKVLFGPQHPYFIVENQFEELKGNNFNLPIPPAAQVVKAQDVTKELKGFKPNFTRGELTGKELELQKEVEKVTGLEVPDLLIKNSMLDIEVLTSSTKRGAYFNKYEKEVFFNQRSKRSRKESNVHKFQVISHELGHSMHYALNQVDAFDYISPEFKEVREVLRDELRTIGRTKGAKPNPIEGMKWLDLELKRLSFDKYTKWELLDINSKEALALGDDMENIGSLADTIQGFSKGRFGFGHKVDYMQRPNAGNREIFAHLSENYFNGNEWFKKYLPKTYEAGLEYFDKILNK